MNVLEAIYARKSIRKFKDEAVPKEDILKMVRSSNSSAFTKTSTKLEFCCINES